MMRNLRMSRRRKKMSFLIVTLLCTLMLLTHAQAKAATAAGTSITNTGWATYTDPASNTTVGVLSNTITTVVQNAPTLTITNPSNQSVTQAMIVVDTFTLTNTGNAAGNFQVPSDATFGGTATGTTLLGYVLNGAVNGTCSLYVPCAQATLATQLSALSATAINGTITIGVEYKVSASATVAQTIQTSLTAKIVYATVGSAASVTSAGATGTPTDTVVADARLDVQVSATQPFSGNTTITWTVNANNGGSEPANDLVSAKTLFGASANGIALITKMPTFNSAVLGMTGTPVVSTCPTTCVLYYSTSSSAPATSGNWSTTYNASATLLALYISGGTSGVELASAPSGSSGAGSVSSAQVQFSFTTNTPSGTGSTTANAVTDIVNSAIGGQPGATSVTPVIGVGISIGTADAVSQVLTTLENNTTPSSGTTVPGGASNTAGSQAFATVTGGVSAVFVGTDTTTQGNWHAASAPWTPYVYGSDGYSIINGTTSNPSYATVTLSGGTEYTIASTSSNTDALYVSATSATRTSAQEWVTAGGGGAQTIDVNITDGNTHQFTLYLWQDPVAGWGTYYDPIMVTDVTHSTTLLFNNFYDSTSGTHPVYARWNISGHVRFSIYQPYNDQGDGPFCGYFFDPATRSAVTSSNAISYVGTDTFTQGNWTPGSGGDGYQQPVGSSNPSYYSSNSLFYAGAYNAWSTSTSDVRAPYTAPGSGTRTAEQIYGNGSFGILYLHTDAVSHPLSLYFLDWDSTTRAQTVYVADPTTGAIADIRSVSGFHNGTYVTWNVKGGVFFYFVCTAGSNATYSGTFWGSRAPSLNLTNAVSPTGNQTPGTVLTYTTTFANVGVTWMQNSVLTNPVPANTDFKVGSAASTLTGTGLTAAITYSNNSGTSYSYTPVSGGGGAASGYDRNVTNVRWTLNGELTQLTSGSALYTGSAPYTGNSGSISMQVMVR